MCCEHEPRKAGSGGTCTCGCGCGRSFRRFYSAQEEIERLESYKDELKKELEGVEERLNELKAE